MSEFVAVAEVDSLPPGKGRTVHLRGRNYSLWNFNGGFYCLVDECPHRGASLGAGSLDGSEAVCPMHGWGFDVQTGICALRPDRPAATFPTRIVNGHVEIAVP